MGSGYGGIGAREKQGMLCHACREKDKVLYSNKDTGQKGRNDGESNHISAIDIPERRSKDDYMRPRKRVCLLARDRENANMQYVFCGPVPRTAERNKRKT